MGLFLIGGNSVSIALHSLTLPGQGGESILIYLLIVILTVRALRSACL